MKTLTLHLPFGTLLEVVTVPADAKPALMICNDEPAETVEETEELPPPADSAELEPEPIAETVSEDAPPVTPEPVVVPADDDAGPAAPAEGTDEE